MTEIFNAIYNFLSQLGIPIYPENGVPSDAVFPYLSWSPVETDWDSSGLMPVRIWDRSQNYSRLAKLADGLKGLIGSGASLKTETGYIYLYPGDPWCQTQPLQDTDVKVLYINFGIDTMIP